MRTFAAGWRLLKPFWKTRGSLPSYAIGAALVAGTIGMNVAGVWATKLHGQLTNAAIAYDTAGIRQVAILYLIYSIGAVVYAFGKPYLDSWFDIRWRRWMTADMTDRWFANRSYYRIEKNKTVENADQRIAEDIRSFIELTRRLVEDFLERVIQVVGYSSVLWVVGGALPVRIGSWSAQVPGGLLWLAIVYVSMGTAATLAVGYPLIRLTVARERAEANYRFGLMTVRRNAESIALYDGEAAEATKLRGVFRTVVENFYEVMRYNLRVLAVWGTFGRITAMATLFLAMPLYLNRQISYGDAVQLGSAFAFLVNALSWLLEAFGRGDIYTWLAVVRRLDMLDKESRVVEHFDVERRSVAQEPAIATVDLALSTPQGIALAAPGSVVFGRGQRWIIRGPSGTGKSTMLRAIAGLWPHGGGRIDVADGTRLLFLPQRSYAPTGTLHAAVCYPSEADDFSEAACAQALRDVNLPDLAGQLATVDRWQERLSPGEQQRLAFAQIMLQRPDTILLDEATSALDPPTELRLYSLLLERLPEATIISVAHRESLEQFHDRILELRTGSASLAIDVPPATSVHREQDGDGS